MSLFRVVTLLCTVLLVGVGCSSAREAQGDGEAVAPQTTTASSTSTSTSAASSTPTSVISATTLPPTTLPPTTLPPTTSEAPASTVTAGPKCQRVTDFATAAEQQPWSVTLDGVMGGLSSGQVSFGESSMTLTGELVTNGGGFVLLRTPLDFDAFAAGSFLTVRARADNRRYEMVFKDGIDGRSRQLFHEAQMPFEVSNDWQEIRVELTNLPVTANGRPVDAEPFDKDAATEMGIILKDGVDGSFEIELDWVEVCSA